MRPSSVDEDIDDWRGNLSGELWPLHLKPLPEELLSSWLARLSRAHGLLLHTFCDIAWPRKAIWNRDVDKLADTEVVRVLAYKTGTIYERAFETTLAAFEGYLYEKHNPYGSTPWLMPLGIYHRLHKRRGLQYCAACLTDDRDPYFRRHWRLAFVTICVTHGRELLDCCVRCRSPVNFHRVETDAPLSRCYRCKKDLASFVSAQRVADASEVAFQRYLLDAAREGWVTLPELGHVYSHLYFAVLRQLMKLLSMGQRASEFRDAVGTHFKIELSRSTALQRAKDVERLPVHERARLLALCERLLHEWPNDFVLACEAGNMLSSVLLKDMSEAPFWYESAVNEALYEPDYSPSEEEVRAAIDYLDARGEAISQGKVSRLLGCRDVFRKRPSLARILKSRLRRRRPLS